MLPRVAEEKLAEYCDVFCEEGVFTTDESWQILSAARCHGLGLRVHADQLSLSGGAKLAAELSATTADHLEHTDAAGIAALKAAKVQPVILPGSVYALGLSDYPAARAMISGTIPGACRYPDEEIGQLVELLAHTEGVPANQIVVGSGSGELLCALGLLHGRNGGEIRKTRPAVIVSNDAARQDSSWPAPCDVGRHGGRQAARGQHGGPAEIHPASICGGRRATRGRRSRSARRRGARTAIGWGTAPATLWLWRCDAAQCAARTAA